jgi:transposase
MRLVDIQKEGGKVLSSRTNPSGNRAAAAFRQAAVSVKGSQSELGAFYRRKRSQKGPASAATATAHKIARLYYSLVMNGTGYQEQGARAYEERERERMVANLNVDVRRLSFSEESIAFESSPPNVSTTILGLR